MLELPILIDTDIIDLCRFWCEKNKNHKNQ